MSGARTTTVSLIRIRASSTMSSTRKPKSSACICRPTRTAFCRRPTTVCAAGITSMSSWRESSRRRTTSRSTRRCGIASEGSASGISRATTPLSRRPLPDLKVRVVNVVDLMRLQPPSEHPHGLPDAEFDMLFTTDKPVVFAYHGYPWLVHRLTYRRANHDNLHVRGYKEEGTTTTPFDMVMLNDLDRFHLVMDVIDRVPGLGSKAAHIRQRMVDERLKHRQYTRDHGEDAPEIRDWVWPY